MSDREGLIRRLEASAAYGNARYPSASQFEKDVRAVTMAYVAAITPCGECHIQPGETCDICGKSSLAQPAEEAKAEGVGDV